MEKTKKPIVFISHVHEDVDVATKLKSCIEDSFLGAVDVFVSSDGSSIRGGDRWMQKIEDGLRKSGLVLVLVTHHSAARKWLYFEAGGAFFLGARVVPLLDRSISLRSVGPPLDYLQVCLLSDPIHLQHVFSLIAEMSDMQTPSLDFEQIANALVPVDRANEEQELTPSVDIDTATKKDKQRDPVVAAAMQQFASLFAVNVRKMKQSTGDKQANAERFVDQILEGILHFDPPPFVVAHHRNKCIDDERLYFAEEYILHEVTQLMVSTDIPPNGAVQIVEWLGRIAAGPDEET